MKKGLRGLSAKVGPHGAILARPVVMVEWT